ncbi:MAG: 7-carboxy-7-deazaguanine synthase [Pirellulaceae bacterium]|nr:7-carboxy-7-deazaguanine synthase [Planctomycetales bacterium]
MRTYHVKEIYYTLQGEGAQSGRSAVFCRFAGCNLWSGREEDRLRALCQFCDTDFVGSDGPGGGQFDDPASLAKAVRAAATHVNAGNTAGVPRWVVCTGGEPLLQLDPPLLDALHAEGLSVAVETNGTLPAPAGLDWICVSPKAGSEIVLRQGNELKIVVPQPGLDLDELQTWNFQHFFLQPMDGRDVRANTELAVQYCLANPVWRLSIQSHKLIGLP